jgi:hypothetical protein
MVHNPHSPRIKKAPVIWGFFINKHAVRAAACRMKDHIVSQNQTKLSVEKYRLIIPHEIKYVSNYILS